MPSYLVTIHSDRNAITISNGTIDIFFQKPISLAFLIMAVVSLVCGLMKHKKTAQRKA